MLSPACMYTTEHFSITDSMPSLCEIHSKTVAAAFWTHQLEGELRESRMVDYLFVDGSSREDCMDEIDSKRAKMGYSHESEDCCEECRRRGKETVKVHFNITLHRYFSHIM